MSRKPDVLARNPKAAVIETLDTRRVFDDGVHKVELYRFANPHCGEMIVAYLPKEKILLEADMLDIPEVGSPSAGVLSRPRFQRGKLLLCATSVFSVSLW